jgi:hypothetical protein
LMINTSITHSRNIQKDQGVSEINLIFSYKDAKTKVT